MAAARHDALWAARTCQTDCQTNHDGPARMEPDGSFSRRPRARPSHQVFARQGRCSRTGPSAVRTPVQPFCIPPDSHGFTRLTRTADKDRVPKRLLSWRFVGAGGGELRTSGPSSGAEPEGHSAGAVAGRGLAVRRSRTVPTRAAAVDAASVASLAASAGCRRRTRDPR